MAGKTKKVRVTVTAPARSNAGGATRGKARAAQVQAMNAARPSKKRV